MLLATVFVILDPPEDTLFWDSVFDLGHVALFATVTAILFTGVALVFPGIRPSPRLVLTLVTVAAVALFSEVIQVFQFGRDASFADLGRDASGTVAYLAFATATGRVGWRMNWVARVGLMALAFAALGAAAFPFLRTMSYYEQRDAVFPTLLRFDDSRWERQFLTIRNAAVRANEAGSDQPEHLRTVRLDLVPAVYPGWSLADVHPDWSGFRRLTFTIVSDTDEVVTLRFRVIDRRYNGRFEDRYNLTLDITRGVYPISVPIDDIRKGPQGRSFDLHEVRGVALYALDLKQPTHIHLTSLRLE